MADPLSHIGIRGSLGGLGWKLGLVLGCVALMAPTGRAQLIITSVNSAPVANVQFSQPAFDTYNNGITKVSTGNGSGFGQSFTPNAGFEMSAITAQLGYSSSPSSWLGKKVKFEIYQMTSATDDIPDVTLYSGEGDLPSVNDDLGDGKYLTFAFTAVTLSAGTTYAWGLIPVDVVSGGNTLSFRAASPGTVMTGGRNLGYSDVNGWNNGYFDNGDMEFYATAVPEPATEALLMGLIVLAGALGWRRARRGPGTFSA